KYSLQTLMVDMSIAARSLPDAPHRSPSCTAPRSRSLALVYTQPELRQLLRNCLVGRPVAYEPEQPVGALFGVEQVLASPQANLALDLRVHRHHVSRVNRRNPEDPTVAHHEVLDAHSSDLVPYE